MMAAVFCIGHDCGHESFSHNQVINDIVGNFMHTLIMVSSSGGNSYKKNPKK
jgi:omega-3 fatty acid desaturase (delta-15 desaturase)